MTIRFAQRLLLYMTIEFVGAILYGTLNPSPFAERKDYCILVIKRRVMKQKISLWVFKIIKGLVRIFYPRIEVVGEENLPEEACIIVGNHTKMNGPIASELYAPRDRYTWCAGEMMHLKEVPAYAFQDFWSYKPKCSQWLYKILSYVIAPLSVCVFNNANTIGVYHDTRVISTFKTTITRLQEGKDVVIFPEHAVPRNHIICEFQNRFIDVAKLYYRKTGKALCFVPMYLAPAMKKMYLGKPVQFNPELPMEEERVRICEYLMQEITDIACGLPLHTVVPYLNIPRRKYPKNIIKN